MPKLNPITDEIFTVSDFFTPTECEDYIRLAESEGFSDAPINTALGQQLRPDVRNNSCVMIDDVDLAEQLWNRATDYIPQTLDGWSAVGVNERLRFYRYEIGQQFDWHYDGAFERLDGDRSRLTFMIYLNEDCEGGQTSFEKTVIVPETGMALFFVHQVLHKGQPVTKGRKYVLRTDVMYRINASNTAT
jgi:hypothetical protein